MYPLVGSISYWYSSEYFRLVCFMFSPGEQHSSQLNNVLCQVFMPDRVFLLRGNHESKYCTSVYGFEQEVLTKYGDRGKHVYRKCLGCFEGLPLASIIGGRVYTAHGGLFRRIPATPSKRSKGKKNRRINSNPEVSTLSLGSLEELSKARRSVLDPPWEGLNLIPGDVLWSDPSMTPGLSPNTERGIGLLWGPDCTEEFLKRYQLKVESLMFQVRNIVLSLSRNMKLLGQIFRLLPHVLYFSVYGCCFLHFWLL